MMPTIELWEGVGFGMIIPWPTGVLCSNQTGGTSCLHPAIEGIYVPLSNDCEFPAGHLLSADTELFEYFEGPKHRGTGATRGLDLADADFVDGVLRKWSLSEYLSVDRSRLTESHEAWVWGIMAADVGLPDLEVARGFGPYPRGIIFTWTNTD